jgi:hypothetical protein
MAAWLYPISKLADRWFILEDGTKLKVSVENYEKLVKNGRLGEDQWWGVHKNFRTAQAGDEVFIYTGNQNLGIIGYARILEVQREKGPAFHLQFDLDGCAELLEKNPVPAPVVRKWGVSPRSSVADLTPHLSKLSILLPWKRGHNSAKAKMPAACPARSGAGFGDAVQNKKVERAATNAVMAYYRKQGWEVESVERLNCGWDLYCSKGAQTKKVEVKGISGECVCFIITAGERRAARDEDFVLKVVCNSLSKQPVIRTWSGQQMERDFAFTAINYSASLKDF